MKIRPFTRPDGTTAGWHHWCPGCSELHGIYTLPGALRSGRVWAFDGNEAAPTFSPELSFTPSIHAERCRYSITAGVIQYAADSTHAFAGQSVAMQDIPAGV